MGGGVGLSIHSPIRIATERTLFAMPETGIGLFPDVGATWALTRLRAGASVGLLLGLTGERLGPADCLFAGVATHFCPSERLPALVEKLREVEGLQQAEAAIKEVAQGAQPDDAKAQLEAPRVRRRQKCSHEANLASIQQCYSEPSTSAEEVVERLQMTKGAWAEKSLKALKSKSPLSVKAGVNDSQSLWP